jgi:hypothetical protein
MYDPIQRREGTPRAGRAVPQKDREAKAYGDSLTEVRGLGAAEDGLLQDRPATPDVGAKPAHYQSRVHQIDLAASAAQHTFALKCPAASPKAAGHVRVKERLAPSSRTLWVSLSGSRCRQLDPIREPWMTSELTSAATHPSPPA